jgi:hypothetical protein
MNFMWNEARPAASFSPRFTWRAVAGRVVPRPVDNMPVREQP